jgi:AcrR family transcriptional regulator
MAEGLRERNKLRRREQITDAALRLFGERGFDGATIDDIAAAAEVSRRTFFRYFARKEDVVLDWKRRTSEELRAALVARPPEESPLQAVHAALATVAAGYGARPDLTLGLMRLFESGPALEPCSWASTRGTTPCRDSSRASASRCSRQPLRRGRRTAARRTSSACSMRALRRCETPPSVPRPERRVAAS